MTITVKKQVEETFQVDTPSAYYCENYGRYYLLKEDSEVVQFNKSQITKWAANTRYGNEAIAEAITGLRLDYDNAVEIFETILESFSEKVSV